MRGLRRARQKPLEPRVEPHTPVAVPPPAIKGLAKTAHSLWGGRVMDKVAAEVDVISKRLSVGGKSSDRALLPSELELVSQLPSFLRASNVSMQKAATDRKGGKEIQVVKSVKVAMRVEREISAMRKRAAEDATGCTDSSALGDMSNFSAVSDMMFRPSYSRMEPQDSGPLVHKRSFPTPKPVRRNFKVSSCRSICTPCANYQI